MCLISTQFHDEEKTHPGKCSFSFKVIWCSTIYLVHSNLALIFFFLTCATHFVVLFLVGYEV